MTDINQKTFVLIIVTNGDQGLEDTNSGDRVTSIRFRTREAAEKAWALFEKTKTPSVGFVVED